MVNTENVVETVTTTFGGINSNFDQNQHKKANQMEFSTLCHQYRLGPSPQICFLGPPTCSTVELEAGKSFFVQSWLVMLHFRNSQNLGQNEKNLKLLDR